MKSISAWGGGSLNGQSDRFTLCNTASSPLFERTVKEKQHTDGVFSKRASLLDVLDIVLGWT